MAYNGPHHSQLGDKERLILEDKEEDIVKLMDPLKVTRLLHDTGVIDVTDKNKIIQQVVVKDQNRVLLGMLPKRGADAFVQFVNVLIESGTKNHKRLARILRNEDPSSHQGHEIFEENQYTQLKDGFENHETRIQCLEKGGRVFSQKEVEALKAEIELKDKELAKLREKLDKAEEENEALRQKIKDLEEEVRTLKKDLEEVKALVGKHGEEMQVLKEDAEKGRVERELLKEEAEKERVERELLKENAKKDREERELLKEDAEKERGKRELLSKEMQNLTSMVRGLQAAAAPKYMTAAPAPTFRRHSTAIRPRNRFEEPERTRPEHLKKSGGDKRK